MQRHATRIIFPNVDYEDRLTFLELPLLNDFILTLCVKHFYKISLNPNHSLFKRIIVNNCKASSRCKNTGCTNFRPAIATTQKRAHSFFQFYMRFFNNKYIYVEWALHFILSPIFIFEGIWMMNKILSYLTITTVTRVQNRHNQDTKF